MKRSLTLGVAPSVVLAAQLIHEDRSGTTPMSRVATLLIDMRGRIVADGRVEQMSYDKYACWCEDTLGRKARDISEGKETAENLQRRIIELEGQIGSHGAEIKQLNKDIKANLEAQRDATAVRDKEYDTYNGEKTESEQCIGALEAATKALQGAGTGDRGFLQATKEVQLLSVVAGVRSVLTRPSATQSVSASDLELVHRFVERPSDFIGSQGGHVSAAQIQNNPFGDYAPQSTQIQGILKGMYDTFVGDLEKSNAEEADAQKAFEALMETKKEELRTLQGTLQTQETDMAAASLEKAESNEQLDDTKEQIVKDEEFFETTKANCKVKASHWSERTRLRTEEIESVSKAINILNNPQSQRVFTNSTTTFVQIETVKNSGGAQAGKAAATAQLTRLAQKFQSVNLAELVLKVKTGGHFDKVIASIDEMIANLRKEEQEDIEHRDRCQRGKAKAVADAEDVGSAIAKNSAELADLRDVKIPELRNKLNITQGEMGNSEGELAQLLQMRNEEVAEFRQAMKDDMEAVEILKAARAELASFYKKNRIPLAFIADPGNPPEYTVDPDKAPETSWSGPDYGGRKDETVGVLAILDMITEDVEKEIEALRRDDAKAESQYENERAHLQAVLDKQTAMKIALEKALGLSEQKKTRVSNRDTDLNNDKSAIESLDGDIDRNCAWVADHFQTRRDKRKTEIEGLIDAKGYLAGAEDPENSEEV